MSGSSLDGLDLAFVVFEESAGKWSYQLEAAACLPYPSEWRERLAGATMLNAREYLLLHSAYGHYTAELVNAFITRFDLQYRVGLIASHGHTTFHQPPAMTAQLGCGAAIAAGTGLPVVSDLRALDVALGGQGAPIVPMGERLLFPDTDYFLNIGGISNLSFKGPEGYVAFDVCPANRVLNLLVARQGLQYDAEGAIAASGSVNQGLLDRLNELPYYSHAYPKSLANDFGTDTIFPLIEKAGLSSADALRTYVEHVSMQVRRAMERVLQHHSMPDAGGAGLLITGGGALNRFLVSRIAAHLEPLQIRAVAAEQEVAEFKEAIIMALLGILRWREEETVMSSVTGARQSSIGGALWMVG